MAAQILMSLREGEPAIDGLTPGVRDALARLAREGASEEELESCVVEADGASGLPMLYFALNALAQRRALSYRVDGDHGTLATATSNAMLQLREPIAATPVKLSRFAFLRRDGERIVVETSLSAARVIIEDERALALISSRRPNELSSDEAAALATLFRACRMLDEGDENEGALAYWNFHDLLFHARTRLGRHLGGWGGTFPFRGRTEPPPVAKPAMAGDVIALETPDLRDDFMRILDGRHSSRDFGNPPITVQQLGEFLYRSARIRNTYDAGTGMQLSRRPYPGGGAVYELEIYVTVRACDGLPPGLYHYCPLNHRLARLADASERLLRQATQSPHAAPQLLLTIAARFARIFWKYESIGYAVILKDAGALFQTMYLVAEAMGLGACAIGGGDSDLFADAAGLDYYAETSVGEFILGSRAEGEQR